MIRRHMNIWIKQIVQRRCQYIVQVKYVKWLQAYTSTRMWLKSNLENLHKMSLS